MAAVSHMATVTILSVLLGTVTAHPHRRHCHLARHKSIPPSVMAEVRDLQNQQEEAFVGVRCHHGLRLKKFPECDIKGTERLTLTLRRVSLAEEVLQNRSHSLNIFSILRRDLSTCSKMTSPALEICHRHLDKYSETVSAECLHHDVLLNLVWLLAEDVRSLTHEEHHETQREDPLIPPTDSEPHKEHNKKKSHRRNGKHKPIPF